jgi:hypothetical protein
VGCLTGRHIREFDKNSLLDEFNVLKQKLFVKSKKTIEDYRTQIHSFWKILQISVEGRRLWYFVIRLVEKPVQTSQSFGGGRTAAPGRPNLQ